MTKNESHNDDRLLLPKKVKVCSDSHGGSLNERINGLSPSAGNLGMS